MKLFRVFLQLQNQRKNTWEQKILLLTTTISKVLEKMKLLKYVIFIQNIKTAHIFTKPFYKELLNDIWRDLFGLWILVLDKRGYYNTYHNSKLRTGQTESGS